MNVFFDTEFTSLNKKGGHRYLISIGCVAQGGEEFYAELTDTWDEHLCSLFTLQTVLPLLQGGDCRMSVDALAMELKAWIEGLGEREVVLRTNDPFYDWPFVQEIFQFYGWPKNLRKKYGTIWFDDDSQQMCFDVALEDYWKSNLSHQHHALVDAKSLLYAWKLAMKKGA